MGQSGNIGWGISKYFKLPNRKRKLLTKEFLETFKEELIDGYNEKAKERGDTLLDIDKETYWSFYSYTEGSMLFYRAMKNACKKHNLTKAIYEYACNMDWFDSDIFDGDLVLEMVNKGVIKKGSPEDYMSDYDESENFTARYKLTEYHKDYNNVEYGLWEDTDRKSLEEIYADSTKELIWLN